MINFTNCFQGFNTLTTSDEQIENSIWFKEDSFYTAPSASSSEASQSNPTEIKNMEIEHRIDHEDV